MIETIEATVGIYGATLIVAIASGFIPVINIEIYLVAVVLLTKSLPLAVLLGVIAAVGQMVAKIGIYKASRAGANLAKPDPKGKLARAREVMAKWKDKPHLLTFVSASTGIPPFFIVSIVAGILQLPFVAFLVVGTLGRTIRFVTIAVLAVMV